MKCQKRKKGTQHSSHKACDWSSTNTKLLTRHIWCRMFLNLVSHVSALLSRLRSHRAKTAPNNSFITSMCEKKTTTNCNKNVERTATPLLSEVLLDFTLYGASQQVPIAQHHVHNLFIVSVPSRNRELTTKPHQLNSRKRNIWSSHKRTCVSKPSHGSRVAKRRSARKQKLGGTFFRIGIPRPIGTSEPR